VPLLQLNRLRLVAAADAKRGLAPFVGSALVRRHPMMTYYLLRSSVDTLVFHLLKAPMPAEQTGNCRLRKRPRPTS
jgi:hypothetical protein